MGHIMLFEAIRGLSEQNSEILVPGYGRLSLEQAKHSAISQLEKSINEIKRSDDPRSWSNAYHSIYGSGVTKAIFESIIKANEEPEGM